MELRPGKQSAVLYHIIVREMTIFGYVCVESLIVLEPVEISIGEVYMFTTSQWFCSFFDAIIMIVYSTISIVDHPPAPSNHISLFFIDVKFKLSLNTNI